MDCLPCAVVSVAKDFTFSWANTKTKRNISTHQPLCEKYLTSAKIAQESYELSTKESDRDSALDKVI